MLTKTRRRSSVMPEVRVACEAHIFRSRGLRADLKRLEDDEQRKFVEIFQRETRERSG
jgi:hypothetical protein